MTDAAAAEPATPPEPEAGSEPAAPTKPLAALRLVNYRRLWLNNIAYFLSFNALRFVFGWYVLDGLDLGEQEQGYVVFALGLPGVFLLLAAGAWADRLDPRKLLMATQVGSLVVFAATAALIDSGRATLGLVMLAALLAGATSAVGQPVRASLIPALVGRSDVLYSAIALNALAMTSSMILGPVLVQLVGDRFGFPGAFWFLAVLLAIGLYFLFGLRIPEQDKPEGPAPSVIAGTVEAFRHVTGDRALRVLFLLLTVAGLTVNPAVMVTVQAFVKEELGRDSGDAAPLFALMGLGMAISSVVVMRRGNMANKGAAFQRAMMVGGTMTVLMGLATEYWQLMPLMFVMGLAGGFYINMNQGLIQANTPQAIMGRVMGLYTMVQLGFLPIGALILGLVAGKIGIGPTISAAAGIALVTVIITYVASSEVRALS
jgi:predicted MFS family arabinose efflux permease